MEYYIKVKRRFFFKKYKVKGHRVTTKESIGSRELLGGVARLELFLADDSIMVLPFVEFHLDKSYNERIKKEVENGSDNN